MRPLSEFAAGFTAKTQSKLDDLFVPLVGKSLRVIMPVVGIIPGFAAQKTIANLFAGFQLAMTQPIRLDDVVMVKGEWGRIEGIMQIRVPATSADSSSAIRDETGAGNAPGGQV